jgi:hypothetical protein
MSIWRLDSDTLQLGRRENLNAHSMNTDGPLPSRASNVSPGGHRSMLKRKSKVHAMNSLQLIPQDREHSKSHDNRKGNFLVISVIKLKNAERTTKK